MSICVLLTLNEQSILLFLLVPQVKKQSDFIVRVKFAMFSVTQC